MEEPPAKRPRRDDNISSPRSPHPESQRNGYSSRRDREPRDRDRKRRRTPSRSRSPPARQDKDRKYRHRTASRSPPPKRARSRSRTDHDRDRTRNDKDRPRDTKRDMTRRDDGRYPDREQGRDRGNGDDRRNGQRVKSEFIKNEQIKREPRIDLSGVDQDDPEAMMNAVMGFGGFKSTKNTKVPGNNWYGVRKEKKTEYRQYMNRVGGFNRPLSPSHG